ncbi:MAG: hypothetical protein ACYCYO_07360 [Bacilli bacterium]
MGDGCGKTILSAFAGLAPHRPVAESQRPPLGRPPQIADGMTVTHLDHMISLWLANAQTYHVIKVHFCLRLFHEKGGERRTAFVALLLRVSDATGEPGQGCERSCTGVRVTDVRTADARTVDVRATDARWHTCFAVY